MFVVLQRFGSSVATPVCQSLPLVASILPPASHVMLPALTRLESFLIIKSQTTTWVDCPSHYESEKSCSIILQIIQRRGHLSHAHTNHDAPSVASFTPAVKPNTVISHTTSRSDYTKSRESTPFNMTVAWQAYTSKNIKSSIYCSGRPSGLRSEGPCANSDLDSENCPHRIHPRRISQYISLHSVGLEHSRALALARIFCVSKRTSQNTVIKYQEICKIAKSGKSQSITQGVELYVILHPLVFTWQMNTLRLKLLITRITV